MKNELSLQEVESQGYGPVVISSRFICFIAAAAFLRVSYASCTASRKQELLQLSDVQKVDGCGIASACSELFCASVLCTEAERCECHHFDEYGDLLPLLLAVQFGNDDAP